jgi:hypothetical protein
MKDYFFFYGYLFLYLLHAWMGEFVEQTGGCKQDILNHGWKNKKLKF